MTAYCMFAGELDSKLETCHIGHRARDVRDSIAKMFILPADERISRERLAAGWREAKKEGWRVAPVVVQERKVWLRRERT